MAAVNSERSPLGHLDVVPEVRGNVQHGADLQQRTDVSQQKLYLHFIHETHPSESL